jgi:hypothetical protein
MVRAAVRNSPLFDPSASASPEVLPTREYKPTLRVVPTSDFQNIPTQTTLKVDGITLVEPKTEAPMPQVDVPMIGKTAAAIVALVCAFSFAIWKVTGFYLIYPPMSVLIGAISGLFFIVNVVLERHLTNK